MKALCALATAGTLIGALACIPVSVSAEPLQTWDQKIDKPARFRVLKHFNDDAVLDRETGLVWERTPEASRGSWAFLDDECSARFIGGRLGWRPAAIEEVLSLMDPTTSDKLPQDHPFDLGPAGRENPRHFWTMSTDTVQPANNNFAWVANFEPGGTRFPDPKISALHRFWCVRGGRGYDGNNVP